jgi:hypothetical protein
MKWSARWASETLIGACATATGEARSTPPRGATLRARALRVWAAPLLTGAAFAVCSTSAGAADPPEQSPAEIVARERPSTRSFYGWQILATGEAGGVLAAAAMVLPDSPLKTLPSTFAFVIGMPFYALGGPATHWTHGSFNKGLISLGGNIVAPLAGGLIGQSVHCAPGDADINCGTRGFVVGFGIALVTVPLIDALLFGWEDIPDDEATSVVVTSTSPGETSEARRPPRRRVASFTMAPAWNVGPRGELSFGVTGRF